ncbi:hypothetical protein CC86DRAFT_372496 [Ophiobolus disseminans]|uniref:RRM domain-containing protein n=1 Tax=Ophiobolus disseminans TaxID=1469910 RepID=A0A6A6ZR72_9PLEO|nr:hypothetical protein CC86DRAFT_372496 [Ophiobolus disseminans]
MSVPLEYYSRCVWVRDLAVFAIEEDIRELFVESGFTVDRVWINYNSMTGHNPGQCIVMLACTSEVEPAMVTLHDAYLFNRRIRIQRLTGYDPDLAYSIGIERGWFASEDLSIWQARLREPVTTYPSDIFAALRESRRVTVENLPRPQGIWNLIYSQLYHFLHEYNVQGTGGFFKYPPLVPWLSGFAMAFDFPTKSEANETIQLYQGRLIGGRPIQLSISKPPLKYIVPWDSGRGGGHNALRDRKSIEFLYRL